MANDIDFKQIKEEAYQTINDDPRGLFPEFEFIRNSKGWYSGNSLKIDGDAGTRKGKVWIFDNRPGYLYDYRGDTQITFWDYLEKVRGESNAFTTLIEYAGLSLPQSAHDPKVPVDLVADIHPFILNKCLTLFADELGNTDIGCEVRAYLATRNYTDNDIERMKLGALPELDRLRNLLEKELNIEQKYINFFIKRMEYYSEHRLTIPCYGKHGELEGFIFRSINTPALSVDSKPIDKYKNLKSVNREDSILNIPRGVTEIVIVEGALDALLAKARGARHVVSLNGCGLNDNQLNALAEIGIQRVILCLDNDEAGQDNTYKHTKRMLNHEHLFEVYIADMPGTVKDADELITTQGMDEFYEAIHYAIGMGEYLATQLLLQFPKRDHTRTLPSMQRRRLLDAATPIQEHLQKFPLELKDFERKVNEGIG